VFAAGNWRGLHTVGVRDFLAAVNGIGHAAVACDPQFRAVLAAHGYSLDSTREILELADYVGPFSARTAQIGRNLDRYERDWITAHPGESPGRRCGGRGTCGPGPTAARTRSPPARAPT
jgi:exodeoxyribonuclease V alpha subunit